MHPPIEPRGQRDGALSRRERLLCLFLLVLVGDAVLLALERHPGFPRLLFFRLGLPWISAQLSLVAVWGALGRAAGIIRLQALLVAPVALALCASAESAFDAFLSMSLLHQAASLPSVIDLSALLLTLTVFVSLPFFSMRYSGLLVLRDCHESEAPGVTASSQFSLRQMFMCTATFALLLGVATLGGGEHWSATILKWFRGTMPIVWVSLAAVVTVWLVLSHTRLIYRVAFASAGLMFAWSGGLWIFLFTRASQYPRNGYLGHWTIMLAVQTLILLLLLSIVRWCGFRVHLYQPTKEERLRFPP